MKFLKVRKEFVSSSQTAYSRAEIAQLVPKFRSGPDLVGRFITGLALDKLSYRGHLFLDRGPIGAQPKFLHGFGKLLFI